MATRKTAKKSVKATRKAAKTAKKAAPKKAATPAQRTIRQGFISHTELASSDPAATREWAQRTFGWKFGEPMPTPMGPYHSWSSGDNTGGGIRGNNPPEQPGTIPYVEVTDMKAAYSKALQNGAREMMAPQQIPGGAGWIAIVQAPGGPAIGLWGTK